MTGEPAQADTDLIISRLEHELGRSRAVDGGADGAAPLAARVEAQRLAGVSADRPFLYKPGLVGRLRGLILVPIKWVLRKMMRWYVEPVAADQRAFNSSMLALADSLADSLNQRIETVRHEASARMDELARAESETSATADAPVDAGWPSTTTGSFASSGGPQLRRAAATGSA